MVRRNLFKPPPPPDADTQAPAPAEQKTRFPNTGAMSGVKTTLKDVASNAVRDIATDMIEEAGPKDRLAFGDADVATLVDSIRAHGQQVPIMVRPLAQKPGHYRVVYGRRRLQALRALGLPAKALVRSLSDEEAILAQGQENTQRLDPSFIEKALFADALATGGYGPDVILDALAVDKPMLSRMGKVARAIPKPVIEQIGSAHGVGRRRWEELANAVRKGNVDLTRIVSGLDLEGVATSDGRFDRLSAAVTAAQARDTTAPSPALSIALADGTPLAQVKDTARSVTLKLSKTETPEFARWMRDNAKAELTRLYEAWRSDQSSD